MFEGIPTAPPDPIFALTDAYRLDPNPAKINLGAGVYRDERGQTPALAVVKEAERRIWQEESSKSYLPIEGSHRFAMQAQKLLFGDGHRLCADDRVITVQTPGGTGALRLVGDLLKAQRPQSTIWIPEPTWVNHARIFEAVGMPLYMHEQIQTRID